MHPQARNEEIEQAKVQLTQKTGKEYSSLAHQPKEPTYTTARCPFSAAILSIVGSGTNYTSMGASQSTQQSSKQQVFISGLHAAYPTPTVDKDFLDNVFSKLEIFNREQ